MAQQVIYLDKSMLLNFSMDFIILLLTAKLSGRRASILRISAGALLGSIYTLAVLLPQIPFQVNFVLKTVFSFLIVALTFFPHRIKIFLSTTAYFYAVSFALGGAVYGFSSLSIQIDGSGGYERVIEMIRGTGSIVNVLSWGFPVAVVFWLTLGRWAWKGLNVTLIRMLSIYPMKIIFRKMEITLQGLVDTGNKLCDPLTRHPVIVVEADLFFPHLPRGMKQALEVMDLAEIERCLRGSQWEERIRIIPFRSVGNQAGIMLGFVPDKLCVSFTEGEMEYNNIVVGLYVGNLCPDRAYSALLHTGLISVPGSAA